MCLTVLLFYVAIYIFLSLFSSYVGPKAPYGRGVNLVVINGQYLYNLEVHSISGTMFTKLSDWQCMNNTDTYIVIISPSASY